MFYKFALKFLVVILFILCPVSSALADSKNWGLGFPTPGEKPTGNSTSDYLKKYDAFFVDDSNEKTIYLTFDAGYENGYTEPILDILKNKQVSATFFLVGTYIKEHPELVKRMVEDGHIIGNHTMRHPDMTTLTDMESFKNQLASVEEIYNSVTGSDMKKYYRPPQGKYSEENLKLAQQLGYKTIFWSLAYMDFDNNQQPTKDAAFSKLIPRVHPGAIVLLHNTSKTNSLILAELIDRYREMGYEFKSLDDLN